MRESVSLFQGSFRLLCIRGVKGDYVPILCFLLLDGVCRIKDLLFLRMDCEDKVGPVYDSIKP